LGYGGIVRDFQGSVQATFYLQVNILAEPVVGEVWRRSKWLNLAGFGDLHKLFWM
jgi:hypothetical protein